MLWTIGFGVSPEQVFKRLMSGNTQALNGIIPFTEITNELVNCICIQYFVFVKPAAIFSYIYTDPKPLNEYIKILYSTG